MNWWEPEDGPMMVGDGRKLLEIGVRWQGCLIN